MSEQADVPEALAVKRLTAYAPVTAEQLVDAGLPLPEGMALSPELPRPSWYRRRRRAWLRAVQTLRERLGLWIAGYDPDEGDR